MLSQMKSTVQPILGYRYLHIPFILEAKIIHTSILKICIFVYLLSTRQEQRIKVTLQYRRWPIGLPSNIILIYTVDLRYSGTKFKSESINHLVNDKNYSISGMYLSFKPRTYQVKYRMRFN
jgi:hypothetical protein